ncbi:MULTISPECIES: aminoacyl-histidine dipeptidase [Acinetobacter]|uniref:Cytosol non-specific dipeptidase n=1 Tax=Acinetobacter junii TaxID=40215 RepID=A0A365PK85_ACIJU|nr:MULTISPECIES: aminoacyl-histidine dipeptidase [Acinetobacter]RBA32504.1 aminoacyl-histidine dipeptidase [Acinetobacter junii]RBA42536.1 aminoacyl-histidine dipeptidase [Acinetobacter junii]RBA48279.1 aminoacyl-histidine dipeptidase [Acinetobacter junii]WLF73835.1 aminoacyl-histidine dipeptidase [Acinetobacter junii]
MIQFDFSKLSPQVVWRHFETLCTIPRPSKHEQQLRQHLKDWAEQRNLETYVDDIGNLIIRKAATAGREQVAGVILQGHLDMVTQANRGTQHDFFKDPIQPVLKDGWLIAENTTLGADNGIGVALALAVLESNDVAHGPIEVLLTIDEEAGMSGARLLESGVLTGQWLFNIDTEEWGELYLGCAGSIDLEVGNSLQYEAASDDLVYIDLLVSGLKGGHSGVDIHLGRGNANVILANFLNDYLSQTNGRLVEFIGGTARNAIPREAVATIAIKSGQLPELEKAVAVIQAEWQKKLQGIDDQLQIIVQQNSNQIDEVITLPQQQAWLQALATCPYGISQWSRALPDVVETSNNIGVVKLTKDEAKTLIMVRSMVNQEALTFAQNIQLHFANFEIQSELTPLVSGWTPNPDSAALKCLQQAYQSAFEIEPNLKVIHAGLECGIIAEHYPDLQMVSFGPDIQGAHAPGERVKVDTVEKCWKLLVTALESVR